MTTSAAIRNALFSSPGDVFEARDEPTVRHDAQNQRHHEHRQDGQRRRNNQHHAQPRY
ncbi:MAG: hypothetical protein UHD09_01765 [Bifidobacterium sp.]|nr:hypothetical protein [Bifidobacterium sp.]